MNWVRKLFHHRWLLGGLVAVVALASCAAGPAPKLAAQPTAEAVATHDEGTASVAPTVPESEPQRTLSDELTTAEIEGILLMREEEKLARDVYLKLYEKWGLGVFQNIARSEETHMAAVKALIDRYGIEDPALAEVGVFTDPELQALYDQLIEEGYRSRVDALRVGAAIEEIDILDLEEQTEQTDRADIVRVYENLTRGSRNHLRAFASNLQRREGVAYEPQYLSQPVYDAIVDVGTERGRRR
jgi:hypothetical protein